MRQSDDILRQASRDEPCPCVRVERYGQQVNAARAAHSPASAATHPDFSVTDLKAHYRARRYLDKTIKSLPNSPDADLFSRL